tara:strand:+ start:283 stop:681 length:399 start_codon:yes stop_codon:yes gene_type:complete
MPSYNQDMKATSGNVGGKKEKDDNENKGSRRGKGPKPMKGAKSGIFGGFKEKMKARREAKADLDYNPVVDKSYRNSMNSTKTSVDNFKGSTPKIGKMSIDDNENKGNPNGKGPKPMLTKGQKRSYDLRDAHS